MAGQYDRVQAVQLPPLARAPARRSPALPSFRLPDIRVVAALAAAGLGLVGGAVAVAELGRAPANAARKPGLPVTTIRFDASDLRGGIAPARASADAALPPAGLFQTVAAEAAPSAGRGPEPLQFAALGARFESAFTVFDTVSRQGLAPAAEALIPRPAAPAVAAVPVSPADQRMLAVARPKPKPSPLAAPVQAAAAPTPVASVPAAKAGGAGAPLVVASLEIPTTNIGRPGAPAQAAPILADEPRKMPKGAGPFLEIVRREAKRHNVPLWVALGVIWVESKFDPNLRGSHGVLGLMQVMPSTARYLGFKGTNEELLKPDVNVQWGMLELAKDLRYAEGNLCLAVAKYKGGFMTKTINAGAQRYCDQLRAVTGMDNVAMVPVPGGSGPGAVKTARQGTVR
ncbi:lytic transglycosylase domain-containing protein [Prosthecomicrobium sp. N25]|uniref:lytic transglycosylase domain-containing protein n=1 Tax=Prosthecomicrobium sp. N25 TaxID=3129254 RepID=UPI003076D4EC